MSSEDTQDKMLTELQKIREAVEPKPSPPPPPPKGFRVEFMEFLNKYGVIGLAIAFIIGGASGRLVSSLVSDRSIEIPETAKIAVLNMCSLPAPLKILI